MEEQLVVPLRYLGLSQSSVQTVPITKTKPGKKESWLTVAHFISLDEHE